MNVEIIEKVNEICEMIESKVELVQLKSLNGQIESNQEIQELIRNFNVAKEKYYEVTKYSTAHPDFKRVSHQLIDAKTLLYENEIVSKYKEHENSLSFLALEINNKINSLIPSVRKTCHKR